MLPDVASDTLIHLENLTAQIENLRSDLTTKVDVWLRETPHITLMDPSNPAGPDVPVVLCEHPNYDGWCQSYAAGEYPVIPHGATAVLVKENAELTLFSETFFRGESYTIPGPREIKLNNPEPDQAQGWDDRTRSIIVRTK